MSLTQPYLPVEVSDVELAFPARALEIMPEYEDIPRDDIDLLWFEFAHDWFNQGIDDVSMLPTPFLVDANIEPETAWRHLQVIMGSFAPKHQHKVAAVAYLLSLWFRWAEWTTVRTPTGKIVKMVGSTEVPR